MANERKIEIAISADGSTAVKELDKVTGSMRKMEGDTGGIVSTIKGHWLAITAAIAGAAYTAKKAWDLAEMAAQYEQSRAAFRSMVQSMGLDAEVEFAKIREKSAGLIDLKSLTESANKAISLGIPVEKLGDLMLVARAKARDMGITTTQAFNDIATGVGRASPLILDNLGLALKIGEANETMARSIGKTVEELSNKEKKMAILNATLEAGKEALDRYDLSQTTTLENMQRLTATVENLRLHLGTILLRAISAIGVAFNFFTMELYAVEEGLTKIIRLGAHATDALGITTGRVELLTQHINESTKNREEAEKRMKDNWNLLFGSSEQINAIVRRMEETGEATGETTDKIKNLNQQIQDLIDKATLSPVALIEAQAKEWRDAGKDRILIEQWVTIEMEKLEKDYLDKITKQNEEWMAKQQAMAEKRLSLLNQEYELRMQIEEQLDRYKVRSGEMSEMEMVERRFQRERDILAGRQELVYLQMQHTENEEKLLELHEEYYRIDQKIRANHEYEAYELAEIRIKREQKLLDITEAKKQALMDINDMIMSGYLGGIGEYVGGEGMQMVEGLAGILDTDIYSEKIRQLEDYYTERYNLMLNQGASEIELMQSQSQYEIQLARMTAQQKMAVAQSAGNLMMGVLGAIASFTDRNNKAMFLITKAAGIAMIWVQTQIAAMSAAAAVAGIPIVGPALAAAAFKKMQILGALAMAAAAAAAIGQMGSMGKSPGGEFSGGSYHAPPTTTPVQPEEQLEPRVINYHIYVSGNLVDHDQFARDLIPSLQKAEQDGVQ